MTSGADAGSAVGGGDDEPMQVGDEAHGLQGHDPHRTWARAISRATLPSKLTVPSPLAPLLTGGKPARSRARMGSRSGRRAGRMMIGVGSDTSGALNGICAAGRTRGPTGRSTGLRRPGSAASGRRRYKAGCLLGQDGPRTASTPDRGRGGPEAHRRQRVGIQLDGRADGRQPRHRGRSRHVRAVDPGPLARVTSPVDLAPSRVAGDYEVSWWRAAGLARVLGGEHVEAANAVQGGTGDLGQDPRRDHAHPRAGEGPGPKPTTISSS